MAQQRLRGKCALITGGAKRIGREIALALAAEGANVVVHYRHSSGEAEELCSQLKALGVQAWTIQADFAVESECVSLIERTRELVGAFEILVNNASIFPPETLENLSWEGFMSSMQINAWTPFVLTREFARHIGSGQIVNLLDSRLAGYDWWHVGYIVSKHALAAFTRMSALHYAPEISVNAVSPGLVLPPVQREDDYGFLERLKSTVPLQHYGDPEDVAQAVVFLLKSTFVTGEVIYVDGGRHLKELPQKGQ